MAEETPQAAPETPVQPEAEAAPAAEQPESPKSEEKPAAPAEPDIFGKLEDLELQFKAAELMRQKLEMQLEHERIIRQEQASRAGYYRKVAVDLARNRPEPIPEPDADAGDFPQGQEFRREVQALREESADLRIDAVNRAKQDALMRFLQATPDAADLVDQMMPYIQSGQNQYGNFLDSGNPNLVRQTTDMILRSAYLDVQAKRAESARKARAEQFGKIAAEKKAAVTSGAGGASLPRPPAKRPADMEITELDAEIRKVFGPR